MSDDVLFVFTCVYFHLFPTRSVQLAPLFFFFFAASIYHLIIQLLVQFTNFLLVLLPLLIGDVDHYGGGDGAGAADAAGAAGVERCLLWIRHHKGGVLGFFFTKLFQHYSILTWRQKDKILSWNNLFI